MTKALIVYGGWEKHDPEAVARLLDEQLRQYGVEVTLSNSLDTLKELDLKTFDLIIPVWTLEAIEQVQPIRLLEAVKHGVGIAGLHGVIDSFRYEAEFHYQLGGIAVAGIFEWATVSSQNFTAWIGSSVQRPSVVTARFQHQI
jgi:type 1 glutamine amidotransferase